MELVQFILILVFVIVIMGCVHVYLPRYLPTWAPMVKILDVVVVIAVVLWCLRLFGVFNWSSGIRVGR